MHHILKPRLNTNSVIDYLPYNYRDTILKSNFLFIVNFPFKLKAKCIKPPKIPSATKILFDCSSSQ